MDAYCKISHCLSELMNGISCTNSDFCVWKCKAIAIKFQILSNKNKQALHHAKILCFSFDVMQVFNCFGRQFCLHFEAFRLGTAPVYMAFLRFMGDDDDAKQFSYSLEVGGNGRKLIWQGMPRSIRDSHRKVRDSHDGLIIQRNLALFCSGNEGQELKLKVAGRIWRVR